MSEALARTEVPDEVIEQAHALADETLTDVAIVPNQPGWDPENGPWVLLLLDDVGTPELDALWMAAPYVALAGETADGGGPGRAPVRRPGRGVEGRASEPPGDAPTVVPDPMNAWWYVAEDGRESGPFYEDDVVQVEATRRDGRTFTATWRPLTDDEIVEYGPAGKAIVFDR